MMYNQPKEKQDVDAKATASFFTAFFVASGAKKMILVDDIDDRGFCDFVTV